MKLPNYKLCTLHLHPIKDADIIQWLDCQRLADSKTNAIRKLIRKQINDERVMFGKLVKDMEDDAK